MAEKRMIDHNALANITKKSEVVENLEEPTRNDDEMVLIRKKAKKVTKSVSIALPLDSYNEYIKYLNDNDIASGSELVRTLLKEKGIIS